jgi:hypothetical protein
MQTHNSSHNHKNTLRRLEPKFLSKFLASSLERILAMSVYLCFTQPSSQLNPTIALFHSTQSYHSCLTKAPSQLNPIILLSHSVAYRIEPYCSLIFTKCLAAGLCNLTTNLDLLHNMYMIGINVLFGWVLCPHTRLINSCELTSLITLFIVSRGLSDR